MAVLETCVERSRSESGLVRASKSRRFQFRTIGIETLEDRRLFAGLVAVNNTEAFPYSAVADVSSWWDLDKDGRKESDEVFSSTAVMIGSDSALTSAHSVYNANRGGFAKEVSIMPGRNGSDLPFGTIAAKNWVIPSMYKTNKVASLDIGVLNFNKLNFFTGSQSVGDLTGWFGYRSSDSTASLKGKTVNNIGYPGSGLGKDGVTQWRSTGPLKDAWSNGIVGTLNYKPSDIPTAPGSSGSPIYVFNSSTNNRQVIGIHHGKKDDGTIGVAARITPAIVKYIRSAQALAKSGGQSVNFSIGVSVTPIGFGLVNSESENPAIAKSNGETPPETPANNVDPLGRKDLKTARNEAAASKVFAEFRKNDVAGLPNLLGKRREYKSDQPIGDLAKSTNFSASLDAVFASLGKGMSA